MKKLIPVAAAIVLSACTVHRQANVTDVDATSGIVRLTYGQAMLQSAITDNSVANGNATKQCQQMGYATAVPFGQPVTTCTVTSGSLCINSSVTLQYQCRGIAVSSTPNANYW
ncbi:MULTISPECIES: YecR family lipoprotein [Enterobacterales]|uniref:YecR family lipoprotein n=1 Tax=Enterobacterales TaxID=91347 RepID=UPI002ED879DE